MAAGLTDIRYQSYESMYKEVASMSCDNVSIKIRQCHGFREI